jgi:hypothetical protein
MGMGRLHSRSMSQLGRNGKDKQGYELSKHLRLKSLPGEGIEPSPGVTPRGDFKVSETLRALQADAVNSRKFLAREDRRRSAHGLHRTGHTVGLAARMEQLAETRSIYRTAHTASSLGAISRCASSIKGVSEPPRRQRPPLMDELGGSNAFDYQDRYESLES